MRHTDTQVDQSNIRGVQKYLKRRGRNNMKSITATFPSGNEDRKNKYWKLDNERKSRLCEEVEQPNSK